MSHTSRVQSRLFDAFFLAGGLLWVMLCLIASPSLAQQDEVAVLSRNVSELFAAGKFAEAVPLSQRVLAINESRLGANHPIVANSLFNLASLYVNQGRYADAEPLYTRALAIYEKVHGPTHASVADALDSLATLYNYQGRYGDAEGLYRRSLTIRVKARGPAHPEVAYSLTNLAWLYNSQGRYPEAEELYKRSLAILERASGSGRSRLTVLQNQAMALNNLANLYLDEGRYADAELLHTRSLALREKVLGPEHPDVAQSLGNLALISFSRGRYAGPSGFISGRWRSGRRCSAPTILMWRSRCTTWLCSTPPRAVTLMLSRSTNAR